MSAQRAARVVVIMSLVVMAPAMAWPQTSLSGAIAGVVRDTSGAVLPGVTVEAASPALIERVRTVVTDGQGLYRITELRPGTYTVTFSLTGFGTSKREGLELTTGFTANVNAEMKVGTLEETVTVSGASPVVDTQNVRTQNVFSGAMLDKLPSSKTIRGYAPLIPGAVQGATSQDVGGSTGEPVSSIGIHGNRAGDMLYTVNGLRPGNLQGAAGGQRTFSINTGSTQEVTFQTGGISAESETGGIQMNVVPKEGGNVISGYLAATYTNTAMQSDNSNPELLARGLAPLFKLRKIYDFNPAVGGPIKKDMLWFFVSQRSWGTEVPRPTPGDYFNKTQGTPFYTPDLSRPFFQRSPRRSNNLRLTWQATQKQKVTFGDDYQLNCNCPQLAVNAAPEALGYHRYHDNFMDAGWVYTATNRLLFEAGWGWYRGTIRFDPTEGHAFTANEIQVTELATGYRFNSRATMTNTDGGYGPVKFMSYTERLSGSYVTGSHSFKTGMFLQQGHRDHLSYMIGDRNYTVRNGAPTQVQIFASPAISNNSFRSIGLYTQDQWTIHKMTVNLGLRFDYINGWDPEQTAPAGTFVPERHYAETRNLPNFKDLTPRMGAAYDLFGNGKTAVKASLGRYVALEGARLSQAYHPANQQVNSATRTWTDLNGNFNPDCSMAVAAANGECGPLSPAAFGQTTATTHPAADILTGFGNRGYNWQTSVSVQHELRPGLGLNVGYFRTWYGNFNLTDNLLVGPADYSPYCVTAPVDARLPSDVSGAQICGLYDVSVEKFGQQDNLVTQTSHYGKQTEVFDGIDMTVDARFGAGALITGGVSTGRTVTDNCFANNDPSLQAPGSANATIVANSPRTEGFCRSFNPWRGQTQFKLSGVFPLRWGFAVSGTYQDLPGIPITASYVAGNAQILPSLGRPLSAGVNSTVQIEIIEPNVIFEGRIRQLDLRVSKAFVIGKLRLDGTFDAYNALNASPVLAINTRYGASWLAPTQILAGRTLKVGTRVTF